MTSATRIGVLGVAARLRSEAITPSNWREEKVC